jgi:hypothetical protein
MTKNYIGPVSEKTPFFLSKHPFDNIQFLLKAVREQDSKATTILQSDENHCRILYPPAKLPTPNPGNQQQEEVIEKKESI